MNAFTLTEAAANELAARIRTSPCNRPTASLGDASDPFPTPQEMVDAIHRKADEAEMLALAKKYYCGRENIEFHLDVGLYHEADCPREDLVSIRGVPFVMPRQMLDFLSGYELDYVDRRFVLVKGSRVFRRLMDLDKEQPRAV